MVPARVCPHCERSPRPNRWVVTTTPSLTPQPLLLESRTETIHPILTSSKISFHLDSLNLLMSQQIILSLICMKISSVACKVHDAGWVRCRIILLSFLITMEVLSCSIRSILISRPLSEKPDTQLGSTELDWEYFWFPLKEIELG